VIRKEQSSLFDVPSLRVLCASVVKFILRSLCLSEFRVVFVD